MQREEGSRSNRPLRGQGVWFVDGGGWRRLASDLIMIKCLGRLLSVMRCSQAVSWEEVT